MTEQITASSQVTRSVGEIRKQSGQVAQAMLEQSRANRDAVAGADNVAKQTRRLNAANVEYSAVSDTLLKSMAEIRLITERNVESVADARLVSESLKDITSRVLTDDNHAPRVAQRSRRAAPGKNRKSR
jgi:methyl-accepting chemotaxis protein